ncbi:MAG TPA: VCBS repeat-containing protein [Solirubrobacteraceae bacterium]|nr:VCBS repeat-containing protein [Solirubrobacteraceae bacterium]
MPWGFQRAANYRIQGAGDSVAIGDLNGDRHPDLAVGSFQHDGVSVLLGRGKGRFRHALKYRAHGYPASVAIGDLNGDGRPDLVVANVASHDVSVLLARRP